jgi:hypothetical protein
MKQSAEITKINKHSIMNRAVNLYAPTANSLDIGVKMNCFDVAVLRLYKGFR